MDVLGLTTYNQIRAVLTVSDQDLPDEVMASYGVEDDLMLDLSEWVPDWESTSDPRQELLLKLFSKYYCASVIGATAPIFVLTKSSDGENEGHRTPGDLMRVVQSLARKADGYKAQLKAEISGSSNLASPSFLSGSSPSRDVITTGR